MGPRNYTTKRVWGLGEMALISVFSRTVTSSMSIWPREVLGTGFSREAWPAPTTLVIHAKQGQVRHMESLEHAMDGT